MKRVFSLIAAIILLSSMSACFADNSQDHYAFYYLNEAHDFIQGAEILSAENREVSGQSSLFRLLSLYLEGPTNPLLKHPFPEGVTLVSAEMHRNILYITVSDQLAALSGVSLILACACLGQTALELSGAEEVRISCQTLMLDSKRTIVIDDNTALYFDQVSSATHSHAKE